jgi:hypothetical protein
MRGRRSTPFNSKKRNTMAKKSSIHKDIPKINEFDNNEVGSNSVKYISEFGEYSVTLDKLDSNGEVMYKTDAKGNNQVKVPIEFQFTKIGYTKKPDGTPDANSKKCFIIVSKEVHGVYYDKLIEVLEKDCGNAVNRLYREEDHFKKRNAEAYNLAVEKQEMADQISVQNALIAKYEEQLGLNKIK